MISSRRAFASLFTLFSLALVIVGLVFLTDIISPSKASISGWNETMYQFLYIGLWITVGLAGLEFALLILGVTSVSDEPTIMLGSISRPITESSRKRTAPTSRRQLALKASAKRNK